ncbi:MAG: hypothetical protein ACQESR_22935 [Planctomycetota bacterium]
MESCPTQAVLPLVGLAAEKVIRDRYKALRIVEKSPPALAAIRVFGQNLCSVTLPQSP